MSQQERKIVYDPDTGNYVWMTVEKRPSNGPSEEPPPTDEFIGLSIEKPNADAQRPGGKSPKEHGRKVYGQG